MKKSCKVYEILSLIIIFAASLLFLYLAFTTENKMAVDGMKSMDFPKVILGLLLLLLVLLVMVDFVFAGKFEKKNAENTDLEPCAGEEAEPVIDKKTAVSIAAILIYIILWNVIGFCLSSFLFFSFESHLLDNEKKLWKTLALGAGITLLIYAVFGMGFKVDFPEPVIELLGL